MDLILDPPRSAGPIEIGMSFDRAQDILRTIPGFITPKPGKRVAPGFAYYASEMAIAVAPDRNGNVTSVEIYRPSRNVDVLFQDISIFGLTAESVICRLSSVTRLEIEDSGRRVLAPDLPLSLWRDRLPEGGGDEGGVYFEAVLVAAPGYYDQSRRN